MDLQEKAAEIFRKYVNLPIRDKIEIIAQAFGCSSGEIETSLCSGKWRGTSDISIRFDNGASMCIGNARTPLAKTIKVQNECVNTYLSRYNPEIVSMAKETALIALREREVSDNAIAAQKGLKPYTLLSVELHNGADGKSGYMGWYYVTLAVDGKIHAHLDSSLAHEIAEGIVGASPRYHYHTAGGLKDADVDHIFNNTGFSSNSMDYSLPISQDVLRHAEKMLAERGGASAHKPSIKVQLAAKPVPGDQSAAKTKDREVR